MATLKDIAREARTSVAVVSKVLNNSKTTATVRKDVEERIIAVARRLGYRPNLLARGLLKGETYTIGVVLTYPSAAFLSSFMASQIISGIWDKLRRTGYSIFLKAPKTKKAGFFPPIDDLNGRVDGVIAIGPVRRDDKEIAKWNKIDIPIVLIGTHPKFKGNRVDYDNEGGAYLATRYLLDKGHKRIALIGIGLETSFMEDRFNGYKRALVEEGIEVREELIKLGSWSERFGYTAAKALLSLKDPPTAIFISIGDHIRGVCEAVREKGLKPPQDVDLFSFNRFQGDFTFDIPLVSLNTSSYKMGLLGAATLLMVMAGKSKMPVKRLLQIKEIINIEGRR